MSGIYFHIPFCKSKCNYCDFYSGRDLKGVALLVESEIAELILRKNYLENQDINTIYFGGGTPSLLSIIQLNDLLSAVRHNFVVTNKCEITFEANPDDLTEEYLFLLYQSGINRLSIGIQSFNDDVLKFIGRRHNSSKLSFIVETAQKIGFDNISVDLIFGIPGMSLENYIYSINEVIKLGIQHISAYSLTIEKNTYFYKLLKNDMISEISEDDLLNQFNATIDILAENGFTQYEISNYAKMGYKSCHNASYWEDKYYLGIGPSAHSYNRVSRQWNVSNTRNYCNNISQSKVFFEVEFLTHSDKYNEYIMTGIRTSNGISKRFIMGNFNENIGRHFLNEVTNLLDDDLIILADDRITLTRKGILISDFIIRRLYFV